MKIILKAKCLVNIHTYEDCNIFEFTRCAIPIYNNMNVISENSNIDLEKNSPINKYILDHVFFSTYDNLVESCISNLEREISVDYSYLKRISTFEINRINTEIKKIGL